MEKIFTRVPGDKVWVMDNNKAVCGIVLSAFYCKGKSCVDYSSVSENEEYEVLIDGHKRDFKLEKMFTTKEELINSL